jgi:hypothetical protein
MPCFDFLERMHDPHFIRDSAPHSHTESVALKRQRYFEYARAQAMDPVSQYPPYSLQPGTVRVNGQGKNWPSFQ